MENHSTFDCSIRNVDVRLNDSLARSNMNGDCMNSYTTSIDESKITHFNEKEDEESSSNLDELVGGLREKLHVCNDSNNCNLMNGCHKTLHEDLKLVDFSLNGLNKSNKLEILNSHIDEVNLRTCEQLTNCVDNTRINTEITEIESTSSEVNSNCLHTEQSSSMKSDCIDHPNACCAAHVVKTDNIVSPNCYIREIPSDVNINYLGYDSESQMPDIMRLIQKDLSEPYSIYTYRYFIHNWPKLCFLAQYGDRCVGAIVCKLDVHKKQSRRGYIAMLAVDEKYRKRKIGSNLVLKAIHAMVEDCADEVVLETEITNQPALKLYENLGFVRDKRLFRYYLNGVDALRLKLWLR